MDPSPVLTGSADKGGADPLEFPPTDFIPDPALDKEPADTKPRAAISKTTRTMPIPEIRPEDLPVMKSILLLSLACTLGALAATADPAPQTPRPLTVDDLWAMERLGSPALSPEGRWVVFTVQTFSQEDNKGRRDLWLVPTSGDEPPRRLTWDEGNESSPVWSPDGRWLAFVAKRGEGPPQLYRLPMDRPGEAEPLTDLPVGVSDPKWFPDGQKIAFVANTFADLGDDFEKVKERLDEQKDDKTQAKVTENRLLRYWDEYRTDGTLPHVFTVDLGSREVKDLMPGFDALMGFGSFSWDLAPGGDEISFSANSTEPPWHTLDFNIYRLDLKSGETTLLTAENPASDGDPFYSPDGRYLLFSRNRRPEVSPEFSHLVRLDLASGELVELAPDWDTEPGGCRVSGDGEWVLCLAEEGGRRHAWALPMAGGAPRKLAEGGSLGNLVEAAGEVVYLDQGFHRPAELMAVPLAGGSPRRLTDFNGERLAAIDFGSVDDVTFEGAGGDPVQMFVLYPPGFDRTKKWPLLMLVHGGPHGAWNESFHYRWNAALFGAPGYVVAALNFHGSTGFGQAFAESILGNHADKPFEDVMKATDHLLAQGFVDEQRMAAAGGSYGGYLVSWILGHTDRFAALVNHAGVYDLMGQFASDYTWSRANNYGAAPWEDPQRVELYSPSRFAEHFATPTLILHGEKDYRVPYTQGVNLHGVLTAKGVPSRVVIFPDENHWILKPQSAQLWWSEVHGWLDRYIGKGPSE